MYFKQFGYVARVQVKTDLDDRCRGFAFVVFADARSVDGALTASHETWDIKRKADLPMYIEGGPIRKTPKTRASPLGGPARVPFSAHDRVLLVGEGDFSFSLACAALGYLSPGKTCATSKEPPRDEQNLVELARQGMCCLTSVDATELTLTEIFDIAVFNFPHTGQPSVEANQDLLQGFFGSVSKILSPGGRVAVTLKQTWPYSEWGLEACARRAGFKVADAYPFPDCT
ncbi:unnamed protein product [Effrenium voratum]|uniref:RRM domain-containing protein n=1 Tax=Effrenium voratum TaxID=2562239 RepID=A0AA36NB69_9DINO|nr:unnamed protein product [Effrenium voratum]CAJ1419381.1 unnamed protein product [Effrenium voratum]